MHPARRVLSILILTGLLAGPALAGPQLEISQDSFDFGYVPQHARVSRLFWLKSAGDQTLKIVQVDPGCSCTQTPLEKRTLPVGDSTALRLIFRTQYYRQPVMKHPKIYTNGQPATMELTFTAVVTDRPDSTYPVIVKPYKLDLSQLNERPVTEADFEIVNRSDQQLYITTFPDFDPMFSVWLPSEIGPGKTGHGHLKLSKEAIDRSFEASFTFEAFEVKSEKKTRFTVPVKRTVPGKEMSPFDTSPD